MQKNISLRLLPSEAADPGIIRDYLARAESVSSGDITGFRIIKKSLDARSRQPFVLLSLLVFIQEPPAAPEPLPVNYRDVRRSPVQVIIAGAGPAGLFAALKLIEAGIRPLVLERGKDVRARRRDLARLNREGEVNPESNYCFGEGGAGTYSDGKLYTRSSKRGDVDRILRLFIRFGAGENIGYDAHPHIGTNKLPQIITAMRQQITDCGGSIHFEQKVTGFTGDKQKIISVRTAGGDIFSGDAVILATGHSARDIFTLLAQQKVHIEAKPFALGVRVEHPQALINRTQYHQCAGDPFLPPAAYSWVRQVQGKGVFSFCMCPGGIIAPAATSPGELVVNGWSPSRRNNPFANSGIVVTVDPEDAMAWFKKENIVGHRADDPLLLMHFQQQVEQRAFTAGGGKFKAPALRLTDFTDHKLSADLPECSYLPGLQPSPLHNVLPPFIHNRLLEAFQEQGRRMKGYLTREAVVVATESRTSSPVRIPRDPQTLHHPQWHNLYPCGEGAGYAGGIVSAAMDGERVAAQVAAVLRAV